MFDLTTLLAVTSSLLSRFDVAQTHLLAARDTTCFVLPQNASLSLSTTRLLGPVDYAFYSPAHAESVHWSREEGYTIKVNDTGFFSQVGSFVDGAQIERIAETERYCLKTNFYDSEESLAYTIHTQIVLKIHNGLCFSNDQIELFSFLVQLGCSLLISAIVYLTCHSSMIIWREVSVVILTLMSHMSFPSVYHDTHMFSLLLPALQNVLMALYFPVDNFWTPTVIILSFLNSAFTSDLLTDLIYLLFMLRFLFTLEKYSASGFVMTSQLLWKLLGVPLLSTRLVQRNFVLLCDQLYNTFSSTDIFNGYRICGYGLEFQTFEICLESLVLIIALLTFKPPAPA